MRARLDFFTAARCSRGSLTLEPGRSMELGSESQNLPGFVAMGSRKRQCRTNGFLPGFSGCSVFQSGKSAVDDLSLMEKSKVLQANKNGGSAPD